MGMLYECGVLPNHLVLCVCTTPHIMTSMQLVWDIIKLWIKSSLLFFCFVLNDNFVSGPFWTIDVEETGAVFFSFKV